MSDNLKYCKYCDEYIDTDKDRWHFLVIDDSCTCEKEEEAKYGFEDEPDIIIMGDLIGRR